MAPIFDYNDIKIDFISKQLDNIDEKYSTKLIVYPVLRYKVMVPVIEDLKLNIFQKNVLSLLNKGNYDIQTISKWLKLDTQLVQMIVAELNIKGFLNETIITKVGREIVENNFSWFDNVDTLRKDIYYIYQDIYSSKLYPVIAKFDPGSEFWEYKNKKIYFETKGESKELFANLIEPKSINLSYIVFPEMKEIFKAFKRQTNIGSSGNDKEVPILIQYLDDAPVLSYLATTIFIRKDAADFDDIKVLDPFGSEEVAFWLKDSLAIATKKNDKLKKIMDELVLSTQASINEQVSEVLRDIHNKAVGKAKVLFGDESHRYVNLYKSMIDLYKDFFLYKYNNTDGKYLKEAFKNSQTVLETLFEYIFKEYQTGYEIMLHSGSCIDRIDNDIVAKKALKLNRAIEIPEWGFGYITSVNNVLLNKNTSLRPKYIAAILAAQYDENNPMSLFVKNKNDLLVFLENVATGRNKVGHKYIDISNDEMGEYYNEVMEVLSGIEEIIKIFLGEK